MSELTLGQKLKEFRKRAGISQLNLEVKIDASPGSLSRIESGQVNPTKETIIAIADALDLNDEQIASLFRLNIYDNENLLNVINNFSQELDSSIAIQVAVDEIANKLNMRNVSVLLIEGRYLRGKYMNNNQNSTNSIKLIGIPFDKLSVEITHKGSLFLKSIYGGNEIQSNKLKEFASGATSDENADELQRRTNINYAIVLPLEFKDEKLGCIFFAKEETFSYDKELPILWAIARQLSIQIYKNEAIKRLEKLKQI